MSAIKPSPRPQAPEAAAAPLTSKEQTKAGAAAAATGWNAYEVWRTRIFGGEKKAV
jgi:hypothetical protein